MKLAKISEENKAIWQKRRAVFGGELNCIN